MLLFSSYQAVLGGETYTVKVSSKRVSHLRKETSSLPNSKLNYGRPTDRFVVNTGPSKRQKFETSALQLPTPRRISVPPPHCVEGY